MVYKGSSDQVLLRIQVLGNLRPAVAEIAHDGVALGENEFSLAVLLWISCTIQSCINALDHHGQLAQGIDLGKALRFVLVLVDSNLLVAHVGNASYFEEGHHSSRRGRGVVEKELDCFCVGRHQAFGGSAD